MTPDFPSIELHKALAKVLPDVSTLNVQVVGTRVQEGTVYHIVRVWVAETMLGLPTDLVLLWTGQGFADRLGARIRLSVRTVTRQGTTFLLMPREGT